MKEEIKTCEKKKRKNINEKKEQKRNAIQNSLEEPPKKKKMWMGDGLEGLSDEDLSDSDEEADESKTVAVA